MSETLPAETVDTTAGDLHRKRLPFGTLTFIGAGISLAFCFAQVLIPLIWPLLGLATFDLNIHLQAIFMWGFGLLTVFGLLSDRRHHGASMPLALGIVGVVIIAFTLYVHYEVLILIIGYVLLFISALVNQIQMLRNLSREVITLNGSLEQRVENQVAEIERLGRLKNFLSDEVAELITNEGNEGLLNSHRRLIACLFGDVRNFTAFSEAVEPEDVMNVLQTVHKEMGALIAKHGGTIGYRAGDGLMVIFNDPLPSDAPVFDAAKLAVEMQQTFTEIEAPWRRMGHEIGFGIGIAYGYATLGLIGSEGRYDYTAIGNVVNIAARLSDAAGSGEILLGKRAFLEIEEAVRTEDAGELELKGVGQTVEAFRLLDLGNS